MWRLSQQVHASNAFPLTDFAPVPVYFRFRANQKHKPWRGGEVRSWQHLVAHFDKGAQGRKRWQSSQPGSRGRFDGLCEHSACRALQVYLHRDSVHLVGRGSSLHVLKPSSEHLTIFNEEVSHKERLRLIPSSALRPQSWVHGAVHPGTNLNETKLCRALGGHDDLTVRGSLFHSQGTQALEHVGVEPLQCGTVSAIILQCSGHVVSNTTIGSCLRTDPRG
mmetsp:Transcript_15013/g.41559  ORF Transcript_15013/g.41559 Transcript_15013/m.41559 type:complete len:221 (+) Transcript_15013:443-1105(+)